MFGKKKKKVQDNTIPSSITGSIPYVAVYENGIIEVRPGVFSKSYLLPDANFKTASDNDQWSLAEQYSEFMNSFDSGVDVQITLHTRTMDVDALREKVFMGARDDSLNEYREEYNQMLEGKMSAAKNNLETDRILTVTIWAIDIAVATERFQQIDSVVAENMLTMTNQMVTPLAIHERLDILNRIYNPDATQPIYQTRVIDGRKVESFSLSGCAEQGISTKDVIAPDALEFKSNIAKVGDYVAKAYYVSSYPSYIKGTILTDFAQIPTNMLTSVYFTPVDQREGLSMVREKSVNIKSEVINAERNAAKNKIFGDIAVPTNLKDAKTEVESLFGKITKDNIRLYMVTFLFVLFAKDEAELKSFEDQLKLIASKNLLTIKVLSAQQEQGLNSALPLGRNDISVQRLMTTQSIASIIPFSMKEVRHGGGMYYGLNAVSKNMIIYDRLTEVNPSACILGMPGAGKSFTAKREIVNVRLNTDDEIYVIDPEREYVVLAEKFGGSVVKIATGSDIHINPFDLNLNNADDAGDPVKIKCDFIETLCDIMVGGKYGLSPIEKTMISRSVISVYEPYLQHLKKRGLSQDPTHAPTLKDFHANLSKQPFVEARNLAVSLERYVDGALDVFSHRTNISTSGGFVVYDIKDIGAGLKELGLQIALDNIWNRMIENKQKGKRTWIYVDEFYLLMQKPLSAAYVSQIWKRARKWMGVPCAITQNVEDMLKSEDARTIINNSPFLILLGQSPINKQQLSQMLGISPAEQKYIASAKPGQGLLRIGGDLIPMNDAFPKNTKLYEIMSTNPNEIRTT